MEFTAPIPPEALLREHIGWSFPLQGLRYWVLGVTTPGAAVEALEFDPQGRPAHFVQSGWRIVYRRYVGVHDFELRSASISITRASKPGSW